MATDITLTIYRDRMVPDVMSGFATIEAAEADALSRHFVLGWKIEQGGIVVAESINKRKRE